VNSPDFFLYGAPPRRNELRKKHSSKISPHHASTEYRYPAIRLPDYLAPSRAWRSTRVLQTVHEGELAFLVVISCARKNADQRTEKSENAKFGVNSLRIHTAEVAGSNPAGLIGFRFFSLSFDNSLETSILASSLALTIFLSTISLTRPLAENTPQFFPFPLPALFCDEQV